MAECERQCESHRRGPNRFTRRQFLLAAGGVAGSMLLPLARPALAAFPASRLPRVPIYPKGKAKVTLVFSHIPSGSPTWPMKDYDYAGRARDLAARLAAACPQVEFATKSAHSKAEAEAIVKAGGDLDGYVVYDLGIWTGAPEVLMRSGKPVVLVDDLFAGSGETLINGGAAVREKLPVVTVCSSDFRDVAAAVNLFPVIRAMKESCIMAVTDADLAGPCDRIKQFLGTQVVRLTAKELAACYDRTDEARAAAWADLWIGQARRMVEPTRAEVIKSGRMHLALLRAAADRRADAVTMDCLGMFYSGRATAYPCLSFFQMNNEGGTGVCECDLASTCTQLMLRYLAGRPAYVSDPVIDTARSEIIYAHCVASNRVFGPAGPANPYLIRSHAEDGKGAVVQSLMPLQQAVTTLEMDPFGKRMVIHTGVTTRNVDEPKACRTKLAARVPAERVLANWEMGWHRVTVYGEWRRPLLQLARLLGVTAFEEDRA